MLDTHLRPRAGAWMEPTVQRFLKRGTKPDTLTVQSLLLALVAALLLFLSSSPGLAPLLLPAGFLILLSGALDALDGALARKVGPTKRGDFLDHAFDRFGDVLLLGGIVFAGYAPFPWGFAALATMMLTSYLGTQAQALGLGRVYGGLLGRLDRMLAIAVAAGLQFLVPGPVFGFTMLGWLVVGFTVLGGVTIVQRFVEVWGKLRTA